MRLSFGRLLIFVAIMGFAAASKPLHAAPSVGSATAPSILAEPTMGSGSIGPSIAQSHEIEVRLNDDLSGLTSEVVPAVADELDVESFTIPGRELERAEMPQLLTDTLKRCFRDQEFVFSLGETDVDVPISSNTLSTRVRDGNQIDAEIDMPGFSVDTSLRFEWEMRDTWWCRNFGSGDHDIVLNINVDGLDGEIDVEIREEDSTIGLDRVLDFGAEVDDVSFDSSILTTIVNLGLSAASGLDLFGLSCGSLTDCVNELVLAELTDHPDIQAAVEEALVGGLQVALALEGGTEIDGAPMDYAVSLEGLETSDARDRVTTFWDVTVSSDVVDACADDLLHPTFYAASSPSTTSDIDVLVPFALIGDLIGFAADSGLLCPRFFASDGIMGGATFEVRPDGAYDIVANDDDPGLVHISMPFAAEAVAGIGSSTIEGDLSVDSRIESSCAGALVLAVEGVDITGVTGSLSLLGTTVSSTEFVSSFVDELEDELSASLPSFTVVPGMFDASGVASRYLELADVRTDGESIRAGFDFASGSDPDCDDSGSGGGGGGGGGGGFGGGILDGPHLPNHFDDLVPMDETDDAPEDRFGGIGETDSLTIP